MNALLLFATFFLFVGAVIFRLENFRLAEAVYYLQSVYFILVLFYLLELWQKSKTRTEEKLKQAEKNRQYCEAYDELRTLVRERQHDMDNHISAILGMIYTISDRDELIRSQKAYCRELQESHEEIKLYLAIENRLIAGFLFMKIREAAAYQIKVTNRIIFQEKILPVSDYDFIEITGILLDNAVEALTGGAEVPGKIHLEVINGKENLYILAANASVPLSPEEMTLFFREDYTSKGKGRGIGLKKLGRLVQSLHGEVIVSGEAAEEAWFIKFEVVIPRKQ